MSKLFYTFDDISISFSNFLHSSCPFLPKTCLNIMSDVISSMIMSSSCITKNISLSCKGSKFDFINPDSVYRRIRRFFNNSNYDPYLIYDSIISHVVSNFSCKHPDNVFDHMFVSDSFVTFLLSLRIGKKSVPLWFRSFSDGQKKTLLVTYMRFQ